MNGSFGVNNAPLTNNPFISDTSDPRNRYPDISTTSHPSSRYPDISIPPTQSTWTHPTHPTHPTFSSGGQPQYQPVYQQYPQQQQQQQQQNIPTGYTQQPQQQQQQQNNPTGYTQQQQPQNFPSYPQSQPQIMSPFQPSNSLRQNLQPSISGSSYSYLQQGQPQPQAPQNGYNPAQQQLQNNPGYIAQFDPYGSNTQGWADSTSQPHNSPTNAINNSGYGNLSSGPASDNPHPRDYMRSHRQEIEAWDGYAWKQFLNTFEALEKAWEARRKELSRKVAGLQAQLQYAGYYNQAQIQQQIGWHQGVSWFVISSGMVNIDVSH